jgi:hypothetical protein
MICRTIASDVKLCANMPRPVSRPVLDASNPSRVEEEEVKKIVAMVNESEKNESSIPGTTVLGGVTNDVAANDDQSEEAESARGDNDQNFQRKLHADIECPNAPMKVAFITSFVPRHDGLAYYASQLIRSSTQACPTIVLDVFAVVLDFFSAYSEGYNESDVRHVIFRESWVDYESAARLINEEYDAALINFKLGAFGGTSCSYAVCLVKSITKPVISVIHSINHHMDDELQVSLAWLTRR